MLDVEKTSFHLKNNHRGTKNENEYIEVKASALRMSEPLGEVTPLLVSKQNRNLGEEPASWQRTGQAPSLLGTDRMYRGSDVRYPLLSHLPTRKISSGSSVCLLIKCDDDDLLIRQVTYCGP